MATRFYLSSTAVPAITPAGGFAAWTTTAGASVLGMFIAPDQSAAATFSTWANSTAAANATALAVQFVSQPMSAGIAFATSDTFSMQVRCAESAANDNINRQPICIKVYDITGTILQATLKALAHYGPNTTEWIVTTLTNKTVATAVALDANYTTAEGDILVIEIGSQASSAGGATVTGSQSFGANSATDLTANQETDTSAFNSWFEVSRAITFYQGSKGAQYFGGTSYGVQSAGGPSPALPLGLRGGVGQVGPSPLGMSIFRPTLRLSFDLQQSGDVTVAVTGVSASGATGNESVTADGNVSLTGVSTDGNTLGTVSIYTQDATFGPSYGVQSGGGVIVPLGAPGMGYPKPGLPFGITELRPAMRISDLEQNDFVPDVTVIVTGVSSDGNSLGTVAVTADVNVSPTGVSTAAVLGTATGDVTVPVTGAPSYGVQSGGGVAPNLPIGLRGGVGMPSASPLGFAIFRPTIPVPLDDPRQDMTVFTTGLSTASVLGTIAVTGDANISQTGLSAAGVTGNEAVSADGNVTLTGVSGAGTLGNESVVVDVSIAQAGLSAAGQTGTVAVTGTAVVTLAGLSAAVVLGSANVGGDVSISATGVSAAGAMGSVSIGNDATVAVTGVSAAGAVHSVTSVTGDANLMPLGVAVNVIISAVVATGDPVPTVVGGPSYGVQSGGGIAPNLPFGNRGNVGHPAASPLGFAVLRPTLRPQDLNGFISIDATIAVTGVSADGNSVGTVVAFGVGDQTTTLPSYGVQSGGGVVSTVGQAASVGYPSTGLPPGVTQFRPSPFTRFDLAQSSDVTVLVTGVISSGVTGNESVTGTAVVSPTGVNAIGVLGTTSAGTGDANVAVTGLSTASVLNGPTSVTGTAVVNPTGVVIASGTVGAVTVVLLQAVPVTGVSGAGAVHSVTVTGTAVVNPTGVNTTGAVGAISVSTGGDVSVGVSGISASGVAGSPAVRGDGNLSVTGASMIGATGSPAISGGAVVASTGVAMAGVEGTAVAAAGAIVAVTGVSGSNAVGTTGFRADVAVPATGASATGATGTPAPSGGANVIPSSAFSPALVGQVNAVGDNVDVNHIAVGFEIDSAVGSVVSVTGDANVMVFGVSSAGAVGKAQVSKQKVPILRRSHVRVRRINAPSDQPQIAELADFSPLLTTSKEKFEFGFMADLDLRETILSATWSIEDPSGVDTDTSAMLIGPSVVVGAIVEQIIDGNFAIAGVEYLFSCTAATSLGDEVTKTAHCLVQAPS